MSESTDTANTTTTDGNNTSGTTSTAGAEFAPITSQADLDKVIGERVARERGKYADYKDLKAKADEFDKLADANKSEIEKATERVTKAEAEVAAIPAKVADALRAHLVALHEIDAEDAELFLTANEPELLLKQVSKLTERGTAKKKQGNRAPNEGSNSSPTSTGDEREFVRQLFASAD